MVVVSELSQETSPGIEPVESPKITNDDNDYEDLTDTEEIDPLLKPVEEESILERLSALVDIIPPVTRAKISMIVSDSIDIAVESGKWIGSGLWILSTASLLVLLPLALELEREKAIIDQEHSQRMQQQQAQQLMESTSEK